MTTDRSVIEQINRHEAQLRAIIERTGSQNPVVVAPDGSVIDVAQLASTVSALQSTLNQQISIMAQDLVDEKMQQITEAVAAVDELKDQVAEMSNSRTFWANAWIGNGSQLSYTNNESSSTSATNSVSIGYVGSNRRRARFTFDHDPKPYLHAVTVTQAYLIYCSSSFTKGDVTRDDISFMWRFGEGATDWYTGNPAGTVGVLQTLDTSGIANIPTSGSYTNSDTTVYRVPLSEAAIAAWHSSPRHFYYLGDNLDPSDAWDQQLHVYGRGYRWDSYSGGGTSNYMPLAAQDGMYVTNYQMRIQYQYELPAPTTTIPL